MVVDLAFQAMRGFLTVEGRKLSYLDFGGPVAHLLALHGHYNEVSAFAPLAEVLAPKSRSAIRVSRTKRCMEPPDV